MVGYDPSFIPQAIHAEILKLSVEHGISVEGIKWALIRQALFEATGFKCKHPKDKIKFSAKSHQPYCVLCFTLMKKIELSSTRVEYIPMGNFIEKADLEIANKTNAWGRLQPDLK